jgi:hypothetical protein
MYCIHCGNEVPEGSAFCTACGEQLQPAELSVEQPAAETGPVETGTGQKQQGGGLAWKILSLLISVGLIIGGLSKQLVFRGTDSSELLVVFGFLWLAYDIYRLVMHFKKGDAESGFRTGEALAVPGDSRLTILSAALMAVYLLVPWLQSGFFRAISFLTVFDILISIAFIVLVLAFIKKNAGLLIVPAALEVVHRMLYIIIAQAAPGLSFIVGLLSDIAMLVVVCLTVNKRCASNKPFLFTAAGTFAAVLLGYIITMGTYHMGISMRTVLSLICFHGAYFVLALAFRPQPQAA